MSTTKSIVHLFSVLIVLFPMMVFDGSSDVSAGDYPQESKLEVQGLKQSTHHGEPGAQASEDLSTPQLIAQALEAGQIDSDTANLFRAYALGSYEKLPRAYRSDVPWDGTLTLLNLSRSMSAGSIGRYRSEIASLLSAGRACSSSNTELPNSQKSAHFYIEYGGIGGGLSISDYVTSLEASWTKEVTDFGWAAPPVLTSNPPPDNLYHVRIESLGGGLYGFVDSTGVHAGLVGNNPNTSWDDVDAYASCMVLNNDFSGSSEGAQYALDGTTAHEFNHSIQFGYGAITGSNGPADIFIEGGAMWMEDEVFDSANSSHQYLWPDFSMAMSNYTSSPYPYWITFRGMTERYGTGLAGGGEQVMQDFWETLSKNTSVHAITALNTALGYHGTNLNDAFHAYAIAVKFNKTCGGEFVYPYCFEEARGPVSYVSAAGETPVHDTIGSTGTTYISSVAEGYAIHWVSLPAGSTHYKVTLQNDSAVGSLRGSVVCDTGSALKITALPSVVETGESASIDKFDPSGCSSVVAVLTNESIGLSATQFELKVEAQPVISGNTGVAGVTLSYIIDGTTKTVTSDGSGDYSIYVPYNWSGTVTPSETGLTFTPPSRSYSHVLTDQTGQDYTAAGTWQTVGPAGFSPGEIWYPSIALNNGTPYVAYIGAGGNYSDMVTVMKFDALTEKWVFVGQPGFTENMVDYVSLAIANGTPYVAYEYWSGHAAMRVFAGNWASLGEMHGPLYGSSARDPSLVIVNDTPYVAYSTYIPGTSTQKLPVLKRDGYTWVTVGQDDFAGPEAFSPSLTADANGTLYVAFRDNHMATVMKFDGLNWVPVGSPGFSAGEVEQPSLALNNCVPYVAYQDGNNDGKATVMKFDGANWVPVGSPGFSGGRVISLSLAFTGGIPYVAYYDGSNDGKATVMKFDGSNWVPVGSPGFSAGIASDTSFAAADGRLYVAYQDSATDWKRATVMTFVDVPDSPDTIPPNIETFAVVSPFSGPNIGIKAFTASDLAGVTGYMITKIPFAPDANDPGWSEEAPTTYTVESSGLYTLYPWAKDAAGNVSALSCSAASVRVDATPPDVTPPTVISFTATSPSSSFNIPITAFTASDDTGITGYKISLSSTPPAAGDPGWSTTAPITYTVGAEGNYTLYPWAKDTAGNVSALYGSPASVQVDLPPYVVSFIAASPSSSLDIPIIQFTASDSVGVTGYMITASSTPPVADDPDWSGTAPSTYTVGAEGNYTLYPWAKDTAGNVSQVWDPVPVSVVIHTPVTLIVTNNADGGAGSLRKAIADSSPGDTITFAPSLSGATITLASTLTIDKSLTIDGSSLTSPVAISGADAHRVFYIGGEVNSILVTLNSLTIRNGYLSEDAGAGIANEGALTVTNSTLSGNFAGIGGGIYNAGILTVTNSTISGNSASWRGGGIYNIREMTVANSTISGNAAIGEGGGIYNDATATVINSTLAGNSADWGGGIYNVSWGTLDYFNTIVANSILGDDVVNLDHSSSKNNWVGTLSLGPLADNGGPTQTMALPDGSPAIDAGDDATCASADQRGVTRPQGSHCDIGAYEYQGDTTAPAVLSITRASPNHTSSASVAFMVTFSEPVTHVDAADFNLAVTGGINGMMVSSVSGSGSVRTITVNTGSGNGTLRLDISANASITDLNANPIGGLPFTGGETYMILKSSEFSDVPTSYWASSFIERLYAAGITGGCSLNPLNYCPEATVTRAQMAVFLLRGIHGSTYNPAAVGGSTGFIDVPADYWAGAWIKQLAAEGITGGCGAGLYCPEGAVTRAQMAVFLLRSKYGSSYNPPPVGGSTGFSDVPATYWAATWIKQLVAEGITSGCGVGTYCPEAPVTRAQMAVFLVRTFSLP